MYSQEKKYINPSITWIHTIDILLHALSLYLIFFQLRYTKKLKTNLKYFVHFETRSIFFSTIIDKNNCSFIYAKVR